MHFAILEHCQGTSVHWDLLLQCPSGTLRSWALPRPLTVRRQIALELPPHRLVYLTYQGPISLSRGFVRRWDRGEYREQFAGEDHVCVLLSGRRDVGVLEMSRLRGEVDKWGVCFTPRDDGA